METMHFTYPKQVFYNIFFFHLWGPLNNLTCMRKYPKDARFGYIPPHFAPHPMIVLPDIPSFFDFIYIHEYAKIVFFLFRPYLNSIYI